MNKNPKEAADAELTQVLAELNLVSDNLTLFTTTSQKHGDFASSIALQLAKKTQKPASELAKTICENLTKAELFESVEVAKAGFINARVKKSYWANWYNTQALADLQSLPKRDETINIEFVSANPTGPLVLVNAWQAFYGDILARIYEHQGYLVSREFYSNDTGNQIKVLGSSIQAQAGKSFSEEEQNDFYKGDYIKDLARELTEAYGSSEALIQPEAYEVGKKAASLLFDRNRATLQRLGVNYDRFFSEEEVDSKQAIDMLRAKDAIVEKDGAIWLKNSVAQSEEDRVLVRSGGKGPTYFLNDIAYQLNRLKDRKYNTAITIVGADHHAEAMYLKNTLEFLGFNGFVNITTQTVRLIENGSEVKMSKRAGVYVLLEDFLDKIPTDTARFFFGSRDINSHLDIDLEQLISQKKSNPVYYTMYAYVRALKILEKANIVDAQSEYLEYEYSDIESEIIRLVAQIPDMISGVTKNYRVNTLFFLLQELAKYFHDYYERDNILSISDEQIRNAKLKFVKTYTEVLEQIFNIIGITPIEKM